MASVTLYRFQHNSFMDVNLMKVPALLARHGMCINVLLIIPGSGRLISQMSGEILTLFITRWLLVVCDTAFCWCWWLLSLGLYKPWCYLTSWKIWKKKSWLSCLVGYFQEIRPNFTVPSGLINSWVDESKQWSAQSARNVCMTDNWFIISHSFILGIIMIYCCRC